MEEKYYIIKSNIIATISSVLIGTTVFNARFPKEALKNPFIIILLAFLLILYLTIYFYKVPNNNSTRGTAFLIVLSEQLLKFYCFLYSKKVYKWADIECIEIILVHQKSPMLYLRISDSKSKGTYNCSIVALDGFKTALVNDIKELAKKQNILVKEIETDFIL